MDGIESLQRHLTPLWRWALMIAALALLPAPAHADPADIEAAARGVVRVIIIEHDGGELVPLSHGTGFAVSSERIVTNSHVIQEARDNPNLSIGIVPSDGENAVYARVVSVSPRNDLALLATTSPMNLPPLTISGNVEAHTGEVTAVGYPQNVDRAQGLNMADIFRAQPPVKSIGFLSGRRPSREFDTLLHTAPIARGSSGGPLLDQCGRVVGVNSFGTDSGGADAEFFFAISNRELIPFLRANDVTPRINAWPCRSMAELDAEERERAERAAMVARQQAEREEESLARRRDEMRRNIEFAIMDERENAMALAGVLLLVTLGAGGFSYFAWERDARMPARVAGGVAIVALVGAGAAWLSRPDFGDVTDRLENSLRQDMTDDEMPASGTIRPSEGGTFACTLDLSRSRVIGPANDEVTFGWSDQGCVNEQTQYAFDGVEWFRVLVPNAEESVSVARFDPRTGEYRVDRYLLSRREMDRVRAARGEYRAPQCPADEAALEELAAQQAAVITLLPDQANERLVYDCSPEG